MVKSMTDPKALVEKIALAYEINPCWGQKQSRQWLTEFLHEAMEEAKKEERSYWQDFMRLNKFEDYSEARAVAFEEAVKIVDGLLAKRRYCSEFNAAHDDMWCTVCEAMVDAYETVITMLRQRVNEGK